MRSPVAFQFLPCRRPRLTRKLLGQLPPAGVFAILDLEDSAFDPVTPERTAGLKAAARANLTALFAEPGVPAVAPLGVRINGVQSPEHLADLHAVAEIVDRGRELAICLPKVESPDDVINVAGFFHARGLNVPELFVFAETGIGIVQLDGILAGAKPWVSGVVFGMIDYAFDQLLWPFPEALDERVWELAASVAMAASRADVMYVHTPCTWLRSGALIHQIRDRLLRTARGPCGLVTLSLDQTKALLADAKPIDDSTRGTDGNPNPVGIALELIQNYRTHYHGRRSFAVDHTQHRFIPPHEYLAALRYLRERGVAEPCSESASAS